MFTPMKWTLVSLSALWDRYKAINGQLIGEIQNKSVYPWLIKTFEKFFEENWYIYDRPMTNEEFKKNCKTPNDPIEVEQYKTNYTNHYLEYQKMISQYNNIDKSIAEFVQANNEIAPYFWKALINAVAVWTVVVVILSLLF
jgi:hypothetical protein